MILDLWNCNNWTKREVCQVSSTKEIMSFFNSKRIISYLDLANAYFTIPCRPSKTPLFSFFDTKGVKKCFLRQPQGLTSQLLMGIEDFCVAYVDDIFLASQKDLTFDEHLEQLDILFSRIEQADLRIKAEKLL